MFAQASEKGHISVQLLIMPDQTNLEFGGYILVKKTKQTHDILQGNSSRPVINTHTEFVGRFLVAPSCTKSNSSIFTKRQEEGRVSMFMIQ